MRCSFFTFLGLLQIVWNFLKSKFEVKIRYYSTFGHLKSGKFSSFTSSYVIQIIKNQIWSMRAYFYGFGGPFHKKNWFSRERRFKPVVFLYSRVKKKSETIYLYLFFGLGHSFQWFFRKIPQKCRLCFKVNYFFHFFYPS